MRWVDRSSPSSLLLSRPPASQRAGGIKGSQRGSRGHCTKSACSRPKTELELELELDEQYLAAAANCSHFGQIRRDR